MANDEVTLKGIVSLVYTQDVQVFADGPSTGNTLKVIETEDLPEDSGQLDIDGTVYTFTAVDRGTGEITLSTPLVGTVDSGNKITLLPRQQVSRASVSLYGGEQWVEVKVPHHLWLILKDGIRTEEDAEIVTLKRVGLGLVITEIDGQNVEMNTTIINNITNEVVEHLPEPEPPTPSPGGGGQTVVLRRTFPNVCPPRAKSTEFMHSWVQWEGVAGHVYKIEVKGIGRNTTTNTRFITKLRYTTTGATPTTTSTLVDLASGGTMLYSQSAVMNVNVVGYLSDAADRTLTVGITHMNDAFDGGTHTLGGVHFEVTDLGPEPPAATGGYAF